MNPRAFTSRRGLLRFGLLLVSSCLGLFVLMGCFPAAFPAMFRPALAPLTALLDRDYALTEVRVEPAQLSIRASCAKLRRFRSLDGSGGPVLNFTALHHLPLLNTYPALVFALLLAWPMRLRRKWPTFLLALPLLVLAASLDTVVMLLWTGGESCATAWKQVGANFPATAGNAAVFDELQRQFDRLSVLKSFLSTGGRQFLGLVVFVFALAPAYLVSTAPGDGEASPSRRSRAS